MDGGDTMSESTNPAAVCGGGASEFLADLPSRGLFSSTSTSSNPAKMRNYICDHDTSPPVDQIIRTNEESFLIRSLKNQKGGSLRGVIKKALNCKAPGKKGKSSTQLSSSQEGSSLAHGSDLERLKKEALQVLLRERGLPISGTKAQLIVRLRGVNG